VEVTLSLVELVATGLVALMRRVTSEARGYRHGRRGRHKHATSSETKRWSEIAVGTAWLSSETENGQADGRADPSQALSVAPVASVPAAPPPERPGWMDEADYQALLDLREGLEVEGA
jgi:hypothetical protein